MQLPPPLTRAAVQAAIPAIAPVTDEQRPFWSVMIPTYNSADYLRRTLASVLCQDPGPAHMEIMVIDDCSSQDERAVVEQLGQGRVAYHRHDKNQGCTPAFNTCLQLAKGHWIHILHSDDMVLPGFYEEYRQLAESDPTTDMVIGPTVAIDEDDRWIGLFGPLPEPGTTTIRDFTLRQAAECGLAAFPSTVVKRQAYEKAGGYCTLFGHVADQDMWLRISLLGSVHSTKRAFALYRHHSQSDTNRLRVSASNTRELFQLIQVNMLRLADHGLPVPPEASWRAILAKRAILDGWRLDHRKCWEGRWNQARWAWKLQPTWPNFTFLVKSWLKLHTGLGRT